MKQVNDKDNKVILELNHIEKVFGSTTALKDISFSIKQGEIFGFLGPSGAGKTTTIKILTGQLNPTSGDAAVLGKDSKQIDEEIYEQIGIVTDTSGVYERLSVYDNLKVYADILSVDYKRIDDLLLRVGLEKQKKQKAGKLSKGQKQRLVLCRAILHSPKLLFLDEPTSGLDPTTANQIQNLFLELKEQGMSIFLTTHNMEEATKLCDAVALLDQGKVIEYGVPKDICLRHNDSKRYKLILSSQEELTMDHSPQNIQKIQELMMNNEVEAIHSCEPTLEDVFIKVTGRGLV
ncbi:ABC transporter ATP-binding protein [Breznakia pachnodae]|uniref:ABC-2 type transport system ATP-binding protein n=1 Tax=Breznakia pachnodae TaxID=265178 RepID=A0ABU0E6N4_9FIRM|nr:ABC transporter ATP-binding protein [Breznakia pachnodae]MDQ0362135.1 ABC-2 type transport system ATP-binding protein [Breznakia pachnodae]